MKAKLTLASSRDKKPTLSAKKLQCQFEKILIEMILNGNVIYSTWHLSRNGKTYYANQWTAELPLIGNPLECEILSIESKL